jgi:cytochrome c peroxidase
MRTLAIVAISTAFFLSTCTCVRTTPNTRPQGVSDLLLPLPDVPAPSKALASLGKSLFFESRLSKSNLVSCNTCHSMSTFGVDHRAKAEGSPCSNATVAPGATAVPCSSVLPPDLPER